MTRLQPDPLLVGADVLHLVGDGAAVGLLEVGEGVGEGLAGHIDPHQLGGDGAHVLGREAERPRVESRVASRLGAERIQPGRPVSEVPVGLHECHPGGDGLELLVLLALGCGDGRGTGRLARRRHRRIGRHVGSPGAQLREQIGVEAVRAGEEPFHSPQEGAGLGALDDAVVVGRRERHAPIAAHAADGAGGDDRSLVGHEARHAGGGAERARVGQGDGGAREVIRRQLVAAGLLDQLLVAREERGEVHRVGGLDDRHHQEARSVLALDVHGQPQVDAAGVDPVGLTLDLGEVVAHRALLGYGPHDRPADEMGEAHLARGDLLIELPASGLQHRHVDLAEAGGGRDAQAGDHVLRQPRGRALDRRRALGDR